MISVRGFETRSIDLFNTESIPQILLSTLISFICHLLNTEASQSQRLRRPPQLLLLHVGGENTDAVGFQQPPCIRAAGDIFLCSKNGDLWERPRWDFKRSLVNTHVFLVVKILTDKMWGPVAGTTHLRKVTSRSKKNLLNHVSARMIQSLQGYPSSETGQSKYVSIGIQVSDREQRKETSSVIIRIVNVYLLYICLQCMIIYAYSSKVHSYSCTFLSFWKPRIHIPRALAVGTIHSSQSHEENPSDWAPGQWF